VGRLYRKWRLLPAHEFTGYKEAIAEFEKAFELSPGNTGTLNEYWIRICGNR
jgi:hypothetical protein